MEKTGKDRIQTTRQPIEDVEIETKREEKDKEMN